MVSKASIAGQAGGHALVSAVHGHQVDVDVDQQVAFGGTLVDLDVLPLVGEAQVNQGVGVFGIVLGQQSVGGKGVVDPVTDCVTELRLGHSTVEGKGHDESDVVHAGIGSHVEYLLDHHLSDVRPFHRGKG